MMMLSVRPQRDVKPARTMNRPSQKENKPIGDAWEELKDETTAHGIPKLKRNNPRRTRIIWFLILLGTLTMLGYHLSSVIIDYMAKTVNININIVTSQEQVYPAITICNVNPARVSKVQQARVQYPILNDLFTDDTVHVGSRKKRSLHLPKSGKMPPERSVPEEYPDEVTVELDHYEQSNGVEHRRVRRQAVLDNACNSDTDCGKGECVQNQCICQFYWYGPSCGSHTESCEKSQPLLGLGVTITETVASAGHVVVYLQCSYDYTYYAGNLVWNCTYDTWNQEPVQCLEKTGLSTTFQGEESLTTTLAQLPPDVRAELGYQADDMLFDCQYDGYACDINKDFTRFYNPVHGNCYTFNSNRSNGTLRNTTYAGRRYGLQLAINVAQNEYLSNSGKLAGVVVLVHPQETIPFPEDDGILLIPGEFALIGMRKTIIQRSPAPYSDCVQKGVASHSNWYTEGYRSVRYSARTCQKNCLQNHIINNCNCASPYYINPGNASVELCVAWNNDTTANCVKKVEAAVASGATDVECDCPTACEEDIYEMIVSQAAWPVSVNEQESIAQLKASYPQVFRRSTETDATIVQKNFLKLGLYFEHLNYQLISETPTYTDPKFFADIGSCLGLWMGISAVTIVEFLEFGLRIVRMVTVNRCSCNKEKVHPKKRKGHKTITIGHELFQSGIPVPPIDN